MVSHCYAQPAKSKQFFDDSIEVVRLASVALSVGNSDSALDLYKKILQKSLDIKCDRLIISCYVNIAGRYFDRGQYERGLEYIKLSRPYCHLPADIAYYYKWVGSAYRYEGDYVTASENYYTALKILKAANSSKGVAFIYNDLAEINLRLGKYEKALSFYDQAEAQAWKENNDDAISVIQLNKAELYIAMHKTDSAGVYLQKSIRFCEKNHRENAFSHIYELLGKNYIESGDYKQAIHYLQSAIDLARNKREFIVINASFDLGRAFYYEGKYKEAETALLTALGKAKSGKMADNILLGYTTLSKVYKATWQYGKALAYMDTVLILKDSLTSVEKAQAIDQLDLKYKTAEKDKQIAQNQLLIATQKSKIIQKNMWIMTISGGILLLLLVSMAVYRNYQHKITSLEQENKIGLLKAIAQTEDSERSRIAQELHDGIGGMLSAAMMRFSTLELKNQAASQQLIYRNAMTLLTEMGDEIRKAAHNLVPEALLKQSLPDAVYAYCNDIIAGTPLQLDFQSYGTFDNLNENLKRNVYRIVQELLKNIMRHAHASRVFIQLLVNENVLAITVEDNGIGFNEDESKNGMGLNNLQTRVNSLDGSLTIESTQGKGTSVSIEFDLREYMLTNRT